MSIFRYRGDDSGTKLIVLGQQLTMTLLSIIFTLLLGPVIDQSVRANLLNLLPILNC